jgi:hypothetical protein
VLQIEQALGVEATQRIVNTGDFRETQPPGTGQHACRMFRASEVVALVGRARGHLLACSVSNWASLGDRQTVEQLAAHPNRWSRFLDTEAAVATEPGVLDGGTHIPFTAAS